MVAARLFDPSVGRQRLDRYELIGEIASGGMATVYLARLTGVGGFQRFVAMKRLHPHLASDAEFVEMFLDEARLAAGIHHPNVVSILEVGASPVGYYIVMEYIEGDTLARLLARGTAASKRMPLPIAMRIAIDMLAGLHAAHELRGDEGERINLVHRDVSPQNILVGADGVARITDFGVARAASRLSATRVGQLKGKIAYMAPEQAQGDEEVDRRADVFSAGIVIWEALAAKRLFKAEHEAATLSRVMNEPVPVLSRIAPHVGKDISDVVMHALTRDVKSRFATCAQFAEALEAAGQQRDRLATSRELGAYVEELMGAEIAQQRDAVRNWLSKSELSGPQSSSAVSMPMVPSSSVSAAAMSLPEASVSAAISALHGHPAFRKSRSSTLGLILLVALGLAGVGLFAYRELTEEGPAATPLFATPDARSATQPTASDQAQPTPQAAPVSSTPVTSAEDLETLPPPQVFRPTPRPVAPTPRPTKKKETGIPENPYR